MFDQEAIATELNFKAVRSSGSGGQHVNKVSTKVELHFNILESLYLNEYQRARLLDKLSNRINNNGILVMSCGETRSQLKNKTIVTKRFFQLIENSLKKQKERKPTTIPKSVKKKRLTSKRKHSEKKVQRKPPKLD